MLDNTTTAANRHAANHSQLNKEQIELVNNPQCEVEHWNISQSKTLLIVVMHWLKIKIYKGEAT